MSSSAQTFTYVVSDYVADGYVHEQHVLVIVLETQSSTVSGAASRTFFVTGELTTDSPTVNGLAERIIVGSGDLHDDESVIVDVAGDGERNVVTVVAAAEVDTPSLVVGAASVARTASGALETGVSSASGVAEREVVVESGVEQGDTSDVTGIAERTVVVESGVEQVDSSEVVGQAGRRVSTIEADLTAEEVGVVVVAGDAERKVVTQVSAIIVDDASEVDANVDRTVTGIEGAPNAQDASLSGLAERIITATGTLEVVDNSDVVASVGRVVGADGELVDGTSTVGGVAEREITAVGTLVDGESSTSGVSERTITAQGDLSVDVSVVDGDALAIGLTEGELVVDPSTVNGVAERVITLDAGDLTTDTSIISGVAEREVENNELAQALKPTDNNEVTGVAERTVVDIETTLDTGASTLAGVAETIIVSEEATLDTDTSIVVGSGDRIVDAEGAIVDQDVVVAGVAEREVENNEITHAIGAGVSDVEGVAERIIVSEEATLVTEQSDLVGVSELIIVSEEATLDTDTSIVVGSGARQIDASGAIATDASVVAGVAEREVTATGISSDLIRPSTGSYVSYVGYDILISATGTPEYNGLYYYTGVTKSIDEFGTPNALRFQDDNNYLVYERLNGGGNYDHIIYSFVDQRWVLSHDDEGSITVHNDGDLVTGSQVIDGGTGRIFETSTTFPVFISGVAERTVVAEGTIETEQSDLVGVAERIIVAEGTIVTEQSDLVGVAERIIVSEEATLDTDTSTVVGSSGRIVDAEGALVDQDVVVAGVSERIIIGSGDLHDEESAVSVVAGDGERNVVTVVAAAEVDTPALVVGVAERTVVSVEATIDTDTSTVVGSSGRLIDGQGTLADQGAVVTGVAEREVEGNELNQALTVTDTQVSGAAERIIVAEGTIVTEQSDLVGVAERIIVAEDIVLDETGTSIVVGSSGRLIDGQGTLADQGAVVTGVAEREVEDNELTQALTVTDAQVDGVVERTVVLDSGVEQVDASDLVGVAERIIIGSGDLQDDESVIVDVAGAAERSVVTVVAAAVDTPALVSGVAERTVVLESGIEQVNASDVDGVAERTVVSEEATLDTDTSTVDGSSGRIVDADGVLVDQDVVVAGVAERIIVSEEATLDNEQSDVDGVSERNIVLESGIEQVGSSDANGVAERIIVSESTDLVVDGNSEVNVSVSRTIDGSGDLHDEESAVSVVAGDGEREIVSIVVSAESGDNLVDGDGVRTSNLLEGTPQAQTSTTNGVAERIIVLEDGIEQVDVPVVSGVADRLIGVEGVLVSTQSTLAGIAERIIEQNEQTSALVTSVSDVDGVAERIVVLQSGIEQVDASDVNGVGESITVVESGIEQVDASNVDGVAERVIVLESGIEQGDVSEVDGLSERKVNAEGTIGSAQSTLTGVAEREVENNELNQALTVTDTQVSGVAERTVVLDSGIEQVDASDVDGVAERTVVLDSGIEQVDASDVDGVAERIVVSVEATLDTDTSTVVGSSARIVVSAHEGALVAQGAVVTGVAEREVEDNELNQALTVTDAEVDGVAERIIVTESATLVTEDSGITSQANRGDLTDPVSLVVTDAQVDGVAERVIVLESGIEQVNASDVDGVSGRDVNAEGIIVAEQSDLVSTAERIIEQNGQTAALRPTDNNFVAGAAEREITATGAEQVSASEVDGQGSRLSAGNGSLEDSTSTVDGTAERIVVSESGTLVTDNASVFSVIERTISSVEADLTADEVGVVVVAGDAERVVVTLVSGITVDDSSEVDAVGERIVNGKEVNVLSDASIISGVAERIVVSEQTSLESQQSSVVADAERIVTQVGTAELQLNESNVDGVSEREIRTSVDLDTTESIIDVTANRGRVSSPELETSAPEVEGLAERSVVLESGIEQGDVSEVDGVGVHTVVLSISVEAQSSTTTGVAEREVETNELNQALTVTDTQVSGAAERIVVLESGIEQVDASDVDGVSSRLVTAEGTLTVTDCISVGVAERIITSHEINNGVPVVTLEAENCAVVAVGKRNIVSISADLKVDESKVVFDIDILDDAALVPLIRSYALRKPRQRVIISRKAPLQRFTSQSKATREISIRVGTVFKED